MYSSCRVLAMPWYMSMSTVVIPVGSAAIQSVVSVLCAGPVRIDLDHSPAPATYLVDQMLAGPPPPLTHPFLANQMRVHGVGGSVERALVDCPRRTGCQQEKNPNSDCSSHTETLLSKKVFTLVRKCLFSSQAGQAAVMRHNRTPSYLSPGCSAGALGREY